MYWSMAPNTTTVIVFYFYVYSMIAAAAVHSSTVHTIISSDGLSSEKTSPGLNKCQA